MAPTLMRSGGSQCLLVHEIMKRSLPGRAEAVAAVVEFVGEDHSALVESAIHRVLKQLIHSTVDDFSFARALSARLSGWFTKLAAINRAAFVVLSLLECGCAEVSAAVKKELTGDLAELRAMTNQGAVLIVKVCVCVHDAASHAVPDGRGHAAARAQARVGRRGG